MVHIILNHVILNDTELVLNFADHLHHEFFGDLCLTLGNDFGWLSKWGLAGQIITDPVSVIKFLAVDND